EEEGPLTPIEEIVAGGWAGGLHLPRVGAHANFFDLGGHSLLATRAVARLRTIFRIDLPGRALFPAPTGAELAGWIIGPQVEGRALVAEPIGPADPVERSALSYAQQRLWFLDQWQPGAALYNVPAGVRLTGPLDAAALHESLRETVRRHEVLRTTFPAEHGQ